MSLTSGWASPRDEFPESVHALMSLWGGFVDPTDGLDSALEKRLELDFAAPLDLHHLPSARVGQLMWGAGQSLVREESRDGMLALSFTESLIVVTAKQLVITASSSVMLHKVLEPLLSLVGDCGAKVQWASFFRRNTSSPWCMHVEMAGETSDIMAQEYAELKAAFPSGKSFLTGPVDGDHFFHFVFDGVDRSQSMPPRETDSQINVYLYGMQPTEEDCHKDTQSLRHLPNCQYEIHRVFAGATAASFETNAQPRDATKRIAALLEEHQPSRFTVVALEDIHGDAPALRSMLHSFDGYTLQSRTANCFGEGYSFHQVVFSRR